MLFFAEERRARSVSCFSCSLLGLGPHGSQLGWTVLSQEASLLAIQLSGEGRGVVVEKCFDCKPCRLTSQLAVVV